MNPVTLSDTIGCGVSLDRCRETIVAVDRQIFELISENWGNCERVTQLISKKSKPQSFTDYRFAELFYIRNLTALNVVINKHRESGDGPVTIFVEKVEKRKLAEVRELAVSLNLDPDECAEFLQEIMDISKQLQEEMLKILNHHAFLGNKPDTSQGENN